ncbi:MAG: alkaline phosphatase family protein [Gemmatimonadaceae bacterium]
MNAQQPQRTLLLIVADGVRHDVLRNEIDGGRVPAIAALCARGQMHEVSTCFPSVTGPGYVPFLTGRFPAAVGIPGLRWFDRERKVGLWPSFARSYAGIDIWHLDNDLDKNTPTLFEVATPSLSAMSMLGRGARVNFGRSIKFMIQVTPAHFRGDLDAWQAAERSAARHFMTAFEKERPRFATLAITSPDKRAHKEGGESPGVRACIRDINDAVVMAQTIAERGGWRNELDIWLVGDHGHAPVAHHEDVHGWLEKRGLRVRAHPKIFQPNVDVALMVGGNSMAHLYLDPAKRARAFWPALAAKWDALHDALLELEAVDLLAVAQSENTVRVAHHARGTAVITRTQGNGGPCWQYAPLTGDPLELGGALNGLNSVSAHQAASHTQYPDSIVQLSSLLSSPRSGDIVISAARNWDLRSRFEPMVHVSTHGALLREQMIVPLIVDRPVALMPLRSADVFPSALAALGLPIPEGLDGQSFL